MVAEQLYQITPQGVVMPSRSVAEGINQPEVVYFHTNGQLGVVYST